MMFGLRIFHLKLSSLIFCFSLLLSAQLKAQNPIADALKQAYNSKSVEALNKFIETYPNHTEYVQEAIRVRNQIAFDKTQQENTIEAYQEYIKTYPEALQTIKAKQWIDDHYQEVLNANHEKDYELAKENNTISSYTAFIEKYPLSKYYNYAKDKIYQLQFKENISTYSIEELLNFLKLFPQNPKHKFIYDTLIIETLKYLSYDGLNYISNNQLYDIDFEEFLLSFTNNYIQNGEVESFNKLLNEFTQLKSNKELIKKYNEAKKIEELLKLDIISANTYNNNKDYFTTIKNDKSFLLIKKYLSPLIANNKTKNINSNLQPLLYDFRVVQFEQMLKQNTPLKPTQNKISYNQDSTIRLMLMNNPNRYGNDDIYISLKEGNSWQEPFILPKPINSIYNEKSPLINKEGDVLYFYSNRDMTNSEYDLYLSFKVGDWTSWTQPLKVSNIYLENTKQDYKIGSVKDQDQKPMEAMVYIEDALTGQRIFTTQSSKEGYFAYPKQSIDHNIISVNKGYITKYHKDSEPLELRQDKIEDIFSKHKLITIESIFSTSTPDKFTLPAENYITYLAKSLEGTKYIVTISVHTQNGFKKMSEEDLSWQQATLIKEKLISLGINFQNVVAAGYGKKNPLIGWEDKDRIEIGFMLIE